MPRYFFHYRDANGLTRDLDGQVFPDANAAKVEAVAAAKDALRDAVVGVGPSVMKASYEVTDEHDWVVAVVPIKSVADPNPQA